MNLQLVLWSGAAALTLAGAVQAQTEGDTVPVTVDNFIRAESDLYIGNIIKRSDLGTLYHDREPAPVTDQAVIRLNRDTLYSSAVFDLAAGPVTITLPDAGDRFMSMQVINQDQYVPEVIYDAGSYTFDEASVGTRYVVFAFRTLVDPADPADVAEVHALQDAIVVEQEGTGSFEAPAWDPVSQAKVRDALLTLATTLPDFRGAFGTADEVDPVRRLIGAAAAWGGNPDEDALYLNFTPAQNDGTTIHRLSVGEVPVDGFWSVSLYNANGYYEENEFDAYTLNNITAEKGADGTIDIQFGGCDGVVPNCLPIMDGWNYTVRLYRPRAEVLDGSWSFPEAEPVQ